MTLIVKHSGIEGNIRQDIQRLEDLLNDLKTLEGGTLPSLSKLERAPLIASYRIARRGVPCLHGLVAGHPQLGDRETITSDLWVFAPELGWARTLSRFYRLGPPFWTEDSNGPH